ncbi:MAG: helix-turn-helix transcriptional regulator [Candidatus Omnitrophica bacterium]|nr:helix-turn-helix transcriptional regulator [Candidatus Omnitrophota bacterium]
MKRQNWHWDINLSYGKIKEILKREDDPRFPRLAGALLSRVPEPAEVFGLISPAAFCRRYRAIEREILSDEWTREKAAFWKATCLRLSRELRERGEKIRKPGKIKLDDFDRTLVSKIKQCRKNALLSQKELAQWMGLSQQYISGVETGRERVTIDFLKRLAGMTHQPIEIVFQTNYSPEIRRSGRGRPGSRGRGRGG